MKFLRLAILVALALAAVAPAATTPAQAGNAACKTGC
jgi:hypothetical protein